MFGGPTGTGRGGRGGRGGRDGRGGRGGRDDRRSLPRCLGLPLRLFLPPLK